MRPVLRHLVCECLPLCGILFLGPNLAQSTFLNYSFRTFLVFLFFYLIVFIGFLNTSNSRSGLVKAVDRGMVMGEIKLLEKQGGKSGHWVA
jgi:hypothetical protein